VQHQDLEIVALEAAILLVDDPGRATNITAHVDELWPCIQGHRAALGHCFLRYHRTFGVMYRRTATRTGAVRRDAATQNATGVGDKPEGTWLHAV